MLLRVAGFGPFGEHTVNASWVAVQVQYFSFLSVSGHANLIGYSIYWLRKKNLAAHHACDAPIAASWVYTCSTACVVASMSWQGNYLWGMTVLVVRVSRRT